ncbi:unnamed protein product, partial [marine sediment metagenome]
TSGDEWHVHLDKSHKLKVRCPFCNKKLKQNDDDVDLVYCMNGKCAFDECLDQNTVELIRLKGPEPFKMLKKL